MYPVTDTAFVKTLMSMKLHLFKKLGLVVLFSGGAVSIVFAILRYTFVLNVRVQVLPTTARQENNMKLISVDIGQHRSYFCSLD